MIENLVFRFFILLLLAVVSTGIGAVCMGGYWGEWRNDQLDACQKANNVYQCVLVAQPVAQPDWTRT